MGRRVKDDLIGHRFGRLTVVASTGEEVLHWICQCDCGKSKNVSNYHLKKSLVKSCGCLLHEGKTSGQYNSDVYAIYRAMLRRCYQPKAANYHLYGGKGIRVCARWLSSYNHFREDLGPRPSAKHSLDRINPNKDYSPENCRWADTYTQARNREVVKLTTNDVVQMRYLHLRFGYSPRELSLFYAVTPDVIRGALSRRAWNNLP